MIVVDSLVTRLSLDDSKGIWRNAVLAAMEKPKLDHDLVLSQIENSMFNIRQNAKTLSRIYFGNNSTRYL
jgi:hypothetical protein